MPWVPVRLLAGAHPDDHGVTEPSSEATRAKATNKGPRAVGCLGASCERSPDHLVHRKDVDDDLDEKDHM